MKFQLLISGLLLAGLMSVPASAQLASFFTDFDNLVVGEPYTPIGDGWKFFHTNGASNPYFGDAPQGPNISDLENDGAGNQYLNVYSDYNNFLPDPALTNNVFQERTFTADYADKEQTWTLGFDYAVAPWPFGVNHVGFATTDAFIRVFNGAFNLLAEEKVDTTDGFEDLYQRGKVSLTFDAAWDEGGTVQFGFQSIRDGSAVEDESTGMYYDNVGFYVLGDANGDGKVDNLDISGFTDALLFPATYAANFPDIDRHVVLDMNGSGELDNLDISGFAAALGFPSSASAAAVPEPATALLGLFGALGLVMRRRRPAAQSWF